MKNNSVAMGEPMDKKVLRLQADVEKLKDVCLSGKRGTAYRSDLGYFPPDINERLGELEDKFRDLLHILDMKELEPASSTVIVKNKTSWISRLFKLD